MEPTKSDETINTIQFALNDQKAIELTTEEIFVNLRLISRIEVGDKLMQYDKHFNIDNGYFRSITRWYKGENRKNTIQFMSAIFSKAFELNDKLLEDKTEDSVQTLIRLNSDLKNTLTGLNNLKQTYYSDKLVQSEIDVIMDDVQTRLDTNIKNLNFTRPTSLTNISMSASNSEIKGKKSKDN